MTYLEDLGCLGTALVELLGGEVDFKVMDGFEVVLADECTLVLVNVKGLGGQERWEDRLIQTGPLQWRQT